MKKFQHDFLNRTQSNPLDDRCGASDNHYNNSCSVMDRNNKFPSADALPPPPSVAFASGGPLHCSNVPLYHSPCTKSFGTGNDITLQEEGDADIAVVYCGTSADASTFFAERIQEHLTSLLLSGQSESKSTFIKRINLNQYEGESHLPQVQGRQLKEAKLQIAIISPLLIDFLRTNPEFSLGVHLKPDRVIGLLHQVTSLDVKRNQVVLSSFYSYEEWHHINVRIGENFFEEFDEKALLLLNSCDAYQECRPPAAFSVSPRKITLNHCKVYILLKSAIYPEQRCSVLLVSKYHGSRSTAKPLLKLRNPYTLSFIVPKKFLGTSCLLGVQLSIDGSVIGTREVKCESQVDILMSVLQTAEYPLELMSQALDLDVYSDELDFFLASRVSRRLPYRLSSDGKEIKNGDASIEKELPTWLHFAAYYGLHQFSMALLDIPYGEKAILVTNTFGLTVPAIALEAKHIKLAELLEDIHIVATLAQKYKCQASTENFIPTYLVPPVPKPVRVESSHYKIPPPPCLVDHTEPHYSNTMAYEDIEYLSMSVETLVNAWEAREDTSTFHEEYQSTILQVKRNKGADYSHKRESTPKHPEAERNIWKQTPSRISLLESPLMRNLSTPPYLSDKTRSVRETKESPSENFNSSHLLETYPSDEDYICVENSPMLNDHRLNYNRERRDNFSR